MIISNSSFENINVAVPDQKIFYWIAASVADTAAVNPNGAKTLLANGISTLFINGKPAVINGLKKMRIPLFDN